ncbi:MAG: STAS domain-containing protein [Actinomycetota bacterium]
MSDFSVRIESVDDEVTRLTCSGLLDIITCRSFSEALDFALVSGPKRIELDLSGVHHVSAAGVKCLVQSLSSIKSAGAAATWEFSASTRRILDLVGLWRLGIVDEPLAEKETLAAAMRAYARLRFSDRWEELSATPPEGQPA